MMADDDDDDDDDDCDTVSLLPISSRKSYQISLVMCFLFSGPILWYVVADIYIFHLLQFNLYPILLMNTSPKISLGPFPELGAGYFLRKAFPYFWHLGRCGAFPSPH